MDKTLSHRPAFATHGFRTGIVPTGMPAVTVIKCLGLFSIKRGKAKNQARQNTLILLPFQFHHDIFHPRTNVNEDKTKFKAVLLH
jgi:hypothetical protein